MITKECDMSDEAATHNRRDFLTGAMMVGGAAAAASAVAPSGAIAAGDSTSGATIALLPTPAQMQDFLALPDDHPIVMVNLLKFKPDGGQAEYAKYAAGIQPILEKLGAKLLFAGKAEYCLIGKADWDMVALVQYPRKKTLLQMSISPEYRAIHHHREAGLRGPDQLRSRSNPGQGRMRSARLRAAKKFGPASSARPMSGSPICPDSISSRTTKTSAATAFTISTKGPRDGQPILLLHGEPTWCYLYRKMIPRADRGRLSLHRARPDRLRPLGQAGRPKRSTPTSFTSTQIAALVDGTRFEELHVLWPGLGRADRAPGGHRERRPLRPDRDLEHRPADGRRTDHAGLFDLEAHGQANARARRHAGRHARGHQRPNRPA